MVGREHHLQDLEGAVQRAAGGRPSLTLVCGEAGIGKTRLVEALQQRLDAQPVRVLAGECLPIAEQLPYAPLASALRSLPPTILPGVVGEALGWADTGPAAGPAGRYEQGRLYLVLLGVLQHSASEATTLLVVEDVQWADRSTRDFLTFAVRSARSDRLAVIATLRTGAVSAPVRGWLGELQRDRRVRRLELERLTRPEVEQLLAEALGAPAPAELAGDVFARSDGNPFFAHELLAARGRGALPERLRDVLLAPVLRLPGEARAVVQTLAAAGRPLDDEVLGAAAGLDEARLAAAVRAAADAGVVATGGGCALRHALVREAVYAELLPAERPAPSDARNAAGPSARSRSARRSPTCCGRSTPGIPVRARRGPTCWPRRRRRRGTRGTSSARSGCAARAWRSSAPAGTPGGPPGSTSGSGATWSGIPRSPSPPTGKRWARWSGRGPPEPTGRACSPTRA